MLTEIYLFFLENVYWGNWENWGFCSVSCGKGKRNRARICTPPIHGGLECVTKFPTKVIERDNVTESNITAYYYDNGAKQMRDCEKAPCPGNVFFLPHIFITFSYSGLEIWHNLFHQLKGN